eukprot:5163828-Prorocentrum_lima.AAC.1
MTCGWAGKLQVRRPTASVLLPIRFRTDRQGELPTAPNAFAFSGLMACSLSASEGIFAASSANAGQAHSRILTTQR